ncbi:Uracil-DNA glycosylase, family 4 [hydrothermal vent metagenome]|uniref:Type-4 uracil-DNA glycosylase n=1 Tax=hydrothermal vent metagenome TaxID=652676 RepID=A0A3B0T1U2_9ZZZZ
MDGEMNNDAARTLLQWHLDAGADEAVGEMPIDHFTTPTPAPAPPRRQPPPQPAPAPAPSAAPTSTRRSHQTRPPPPTEPVLAARDRAASAKTLAELEELVRDFDGCPLKTTAKNTCFADGAPDSGVMFIGEAPGRDEDLSGTPFVGRAGQLLDKMLAAIGRSRTSAYITNIVYWRPPGNRTPTPAEAAICRPFTERQIVLAKPDILVFLGGAAAKQMLDTSTGIMRLRGKWTSYTPPGGTPIRAIATFHPAYLLRQPGQKKLAWRDFQAIRRALDEDS